MNLCKLLIGSCAKLYKTIHSVHRFYYSVYAHYVPGAILAIWDTMVKKTKKFKLLLEHSD